MLKLIIVRHAKTNQISKSGSDYDRSLLPRGIAQANDLKKHFENTDFGIAEIHVSSAKRTQETFKLIEHAFKNVPIHSWENLYLASSGEILELICQLNHTKNILLIGHNFGISDLVNYLCDSDIILATGELIELTFELDSWNELSKSTGVIARRYRSAV